MARSLAQVKHRIARLQGEALAIEENERAEVIARIKTAINHYALSADDLCAAKSPKRRLGRPVASKATSHSVSAGADSGRNGLLSAKYGDPSGNRWMGRGRRPNWLVAALAEGKPLDAFAL